MLSLSFIIIIFVKIYYKSLFYLLYYYYDICKHKYIGVSFLTCVYLLYNSCMMPLLSRTTVLKRYFYCENVLNGSDTSVIE